MSARSRRARRASASRRRADPARERRSDHALDQHGTARRGVLPGQELVEARASAPAPRPPPGPRARAPGTRSTRRAARRRARRGRGCGRRRCRAARRSRARGPSARAPTRAAPARACGGRRDRADRTAAPGHRAPPAAGTRSDRSIVSSRGSSSVTATMTAFSPTEIEGDNPTRRKLEEARDGHGFPTGESLHAWPPAPHRGEVYPLKRDRALRRRDPTRHRKRAPGHRPRGPSSPACETKHPGYRLRSGSRPRSRTTAGTGRRSGCSHSRMPSPSSSSHPRPGSP